MDLKNDEKEHKKSLRYSDIPARELPNLKHLKKSQNNTPRRKVLNLKLPKVELSTNEKTIPGCKDYENRYLSMSVECSNSRNQDHPKAVNINNYQLSLEDANKLRKKRVKLSSLKYKNKRKESPFKESEKTIKRKKEILVKGESKYIKSPLLVTPANESSLYYTGKHFKETIESKYSKKFEEIDVNKTGFIMLDDIINLVIFLSLDEDGKTEQSYFAIKQKSLEIYHMFYLISPKNKFNKKDFFAACSVYEFFHAECEIENFLKMETFDEIKEKLIEIKKTFEFYAHDGFINLNDFKKIMTCADIDDIYPIQSLIFSEPLSFTRFLQYLPIFLSIHKEVTGFISNFTYDT